MSIVHKSKYTLADIDTIFNTSISPMTLPERYTVYNHAQNEIADLLNDVYQLTNFTISNNTLSYSFESERNRINPLTKEEKEAIKLGTLNQYYVDSLIQNLYDITDSKKSLVLNIAQDIIAKFKNKYDEFGYYQLWYNADPDVFIKDPHIINGFSTETFYTYATEQKTTIDFSAEISYKLYGDVILTYIDKFNFGSNFEYSVVSSIDATINNNLEFSTTFTESVVAPVLLTESDLFDFSTTYTATVV